MGSASDYEQHVCVNDKCRFPKLTKSDYAAHANDQCACGELRFNQRTTSSGRIVYEARKVR